ncbi:MAG TPA: hypothetical protein PKE16_19690 [Hyphomicrobium sp.]|nr:hypothetical protein [Hyphomicrobium sp.]
MRNYLILLIGLAFAVRSLLPMGFMLTASPDDGGIPQIVICTGHGPQSWVLDDKGVPHPAKSSADQQTTCPYAPAGAVAVGHEAPQLLAHTVRYAAVTYALTSEIFRATPKPGTQYARGPPSVLI